MTKTYHQIYLQKVFAAKNRNATLNKSWRHKLIIIITALAGCFTGKPTKIGKGLSLSSFIEKTFKGTLSEVNQEIGGYSNCYNLK